jgi:schlafen family protein
MNTKIPIGQRENQRLEFKSKDALRHLASVGRAVVAMLNSEGGDVWIGLKEVDGVAVTLEPIHNPDQEIKRLRDHFSDSIEPSPGPQEISFEAVEARCRRRFEVANPAHLSFRPT